MFRQEDRPRTHHRRHVPLRVEGTSLLLGQLSPLFNRRSDKFVAFSKSIDSQLTELEERWKEEPVEKEEFILFFCETPMVTKPKPR